MTMMMRTVEMGARVWVEAPKSQNPNGWDEQFIKLPEVQLTNHEKYRY